MMRSLCFGFALLIALMSAANSSAGVIIDGEDLDFAPGSVAAGTYSLGISATGDGTTSDIQAYQFELDFSDLNLSFGSFDFAPGRGTQATNIVTGTSTSAFNIGVSSTNLFGGPEFNLQDGVSTLLGTVTFDVLSETQFAEIAIGGVIQFQDPGNVAITPITTGSIALTAVPEPSLFTLMALAGLVVGPMRRKRRRNSVIA